LGERLLLFSVLLPHFEVVFPFEHRGTLGGLFWPLKCALSGMTANCHISERLKGSCDICGRWPDRLHLPEELHGWYCPNCCPACKPKPATRQPDNQRPEAPPPDPALWAA